MKSSILQLITSGMDTVWVVLVMLTGAGGVGKEGFKALSVSNRTWDLVGCNVSGAMAVRRSPLGCSTRTLRGASCGPLCAIRWSVQFSTKKFELYLWLGHSMYTPPKWGTSIHKQR
ncbi:hypothetical protein BD413DRAFT_594147 [Trametes elegans]|nr:hypothetical protein BD413DRAFT_594147 [Trametes elegans]